MHFVLQKVGNVTFSSVEKIAFKYRNLQGTFHFNKG